MLFLLRLPLLSNQMRFICIAWIEQVDQELGIAANVREVVACNAAQTMQWRVVHAQLGRYTTNLLGPHWATLCRSTECSSLSQPKTRPSWSISVASSIPSFLKVTMRLPYVVCSANVDEIEVGVGDVQCLEWNLDVCKCQLAKSHLVNARKSDKWSEFVVEHGRLELHLAIAELLRELVDFVQVQHQLVFSSLDALKKCVLFGEKCHHPLAHIFDDALWIFSIAVSRAMSTFWRKEPQCASIVNSDSMFILVSSAVESPMCPRHDLNLAIVLENSSSNVNK